MSFSRYPAYKDSGVEWLGEVPAHWDCGRLSYVASCNDEVLPENTPDDYEIEYVEISGVEAGRGIVEVSTLPFGSAPSRARRVLRDGDILISTVRTYLRAIAQVNAPSDNTIASTGFAVLRPRSVESRYLGYACHAEGFVGEVIARSVGVSYPAINASELVRLQIPLPPSDEQAAIAAFLDRETAKIDALVAEQENLIGLLKEKRSAVISHAVTKGLDPSVPMKDSGVEWLGEVPAHWVVKPLGTLAHVIQTGPFGSQLHSDEYVEDATPVINPSNIIDGQLCPDPLSTVSDEVVARLAHHKLYAGDIVLGRRGEMGRCAFVNQTQTGWLCGTGCLKIRLSSDGLPEFVCHYLATETIKQYLSLQSVGSTMENLNTQILSRVPIPVPDVTEQAEICEALTEQLEVLDALASEAVIGVQLLQERRTALISAAVTGQIDVRQSVLIA